MTPQAPVALIFDYSADWAWKVQPHGRGLTYFALVLDHYRALRRAGLSVDILPPSTRDFTGYRAVFAPGLMHMDEGLKTALAASDAEVVIGPRSAARDADFAIPLPLPPSLADLDVTVSRVESLRPDMPVAVGVGGRSRAIANGWTPRLLPSLRMPMGRRWLCVRASCAIWAAGATLPCWIG